MVLREKAKDWKCPHCAIQDENNDALTFEEIECIIYTLKYDLRNGSEEDYSDIIRKLKKLWVEAK